MNIHENEGLAETEATNGAIQTLLDFYNNMEATDNHLDEFGTKMTQIGENLENDLRVWWGNYPEQVDNMVSGSETAPVLVVDTYGDSCPQPAFVATAGELTME